MAKANMGSVKKTQNTTKKRSEKKNQGLRCRFGFVLSVCDVHPSAPACFQSDGVPSLSLSAFFPKTEHSL